MNMKARLNSLLCLMYRFILLSAICPFECKCQLVSLFAFTAPQPQLHQNIDQLQVFIAHSQHNWYWHLILGGMVVCTSLTL